MIAKNMIYKNTSVLKLISNKIKMYNIESMYTKELPIKL